MQGFAPIANADIIACSAKPESAGRAGVMHLSLRSVGGGGEHFEQEHQPALFPFNEEDAFRVVAPVKLSFDVEAQEPGRYRVAGRLAGAIELTCGRCVEPFTLPVATDFDLRYVPRVENAGEGEKEVEEDELATAFYSDDQIDLSELIMEQFHLRSEERRVGKECRTRRWPHLQ